MKQKSFFGFNAMFWAAKVVVKYGTVVALLLLISGFLITPGSLLAAWVAETAVLMFALSVICGILMDVIAVRTGKRKN